MLSGRAARERSVCDAEDETAVPAGVPARGGADAASRRADAEAARGRAGLLRADAPQLAAAGPSRPRRARGRAQLGGAAAAARAGARKQGAAPGARDPEAGRGFLCLSAT